MDNTIGRDMDKISGNTGFSFMKVSFIILFLRRTRYDFFTVIPSHHYESNEQGAGFRDRECKPDSVQMEPFVQTP